MFIRIMDGVYNMGKVTGVNREGLKLTFHFINGKGAEIHCEDEKQALSPMDFVSSRAVLPGNDFMINCRLAIKLVGEQKND